MRKLFVYGTVYNNAEWVEECIASIERLKPELIVITDAVSTDGTSEILHKLSEKYKNIIIQTEPCSRGKGRQEALRVVQNRADDNDVVMDVDFDSVYSDYFVEYIKQKSKIVKDMEAYCFGLMTVKTSKLAEWKDLNYGEDWEWLAHLKSLGVNIKEFIESGDTRWATKQRQGNSLRERQAYYKTNIFAMLKLARDAHKGMAYKNWTGGAKDTIGKIGNIVAHILAYPYYSYDKKLNNADYVCSSAIGSLHQHAERTINKVEVRK